MAEIAGHIYVIYCTKDDTFYIGSTTQSRLSFRMRSHRFKAKTATSKFYKHMRETGIDNFYIELVSSRRYQSKDELYAAENKLIRKYKALYPDDCLNTYDGLRIRSTKNKGYVYVITRSDGSTAETDRIKEYADNNGYYVSKLNDILHGKQRRHKDVIEVKLRTFKH